MKNVKTKKLISNWINSKQGIESIKKAIKRADLAVSELNKACRVDWDTIHAPFGPSDGSGRWPHQKI